MKIDEKNLENLKQTLASLEEKRKIHADSMEKMDKMEEKDEAMCSMMREIDYLYRSLNSLGSYVYSVEMELYNAFSKHAGYNSGHLPPVMGADKMKKALKALGIDGDYSVEPKVLFASVKNNKGETLEVEFKMPAKDETV